MMLEEKSQPSWFRRHRKALVIIVIFVLVAGASVFAILGYQFQWGWTGFNASTGPNIRQYQPTKTLWDWMQLLIVPIVLTIGVFLLNFAMNQNERAETQRRSESEHDIALDNQRETSLQNYLDRMSDLLLNNHLREPGASTAEACHIARVRTLTALFGLDPIRKGNLIRFLYDAGLITVDANTGKSIIDLSEANLSNADLTRTNLIGADLRGADLSGAKLSFARLDEAHLEGANLSEANLTGTQLSGANLSSTRLGGAKLRGTNLKRVLLNNADLRMAILYRTDMSRADLTGADLRGADLRGANLSRLNLVDVNLNGVITNDETDLNEAILPNAEEEYVKKL